MLDQLGVKSDTGARALHLRREGKEISGEGKQLVREGEKEDKEAYI